MTHLANVENTQLHGTIRVYFVHVNDAKIEVEVVAFETLVELYPENVTCIYV